MKVENGKSVSVSYVLTVNGQERDRANSDAPLEFVFGAGQLLKAFEAALLGLEPGDSFTMDLEAKDGYGEYKEEMKAELPISIFLEDGAKQIDEDGVKVGQILPMMTSDGHRLNGKILEIRPDIVVMDFNHELAGESLHFEGKVEKVCEPSEEQLARLAGQHSCGCCGGHEEKEDGCCGGHSDHDGGCCGDGHGHGCC